MRLAPLVVAPAHRVVPGRRPCQVSRCAVRLVSRVVPARAWFHGCNSLARKVLLEHLAPTARPVNQCADKLVPQGPRAKPRCRGCRTSPVHREPVARPVNRCKVRLVAPVRKVAPRRRPCRVNQCADKLVPQGPRAKPRCRGCRTSPVRKAVLALQGCLRCPAKLLRPAKDPSRFWAKSKAVVRPSSP